VLREDVEVGVHDEYPKSLRDFVAADGANAIAISDRMTGHTNNIRSSNPYPFFPARFSARWRFRIAMQKAM